LFIVATVYDERPALESPLSSPFARGPAHHFRRLLHDLRRTNADKRKAVEVALRGFPKLSSREIAGLCGVSDPFIGQVRERAQRKFAFGPRARWASS